MSDGGAAITDYLVQISGDAGKTWATVADGVSTATSATVTGLTNGTSYIFRVAAVNAAGTGMSFARTAALTPRTLPQAPGGVVAVPGGRTRHPHLVGARLEWRRDDPRLRRSVQFQCGNHVDDVRRSRVGDALRNGHGSHERHELCLPRGSRQRRRHGSGPNQPNRTGIILRRRQWPLAADIAGPGGKARGDRLLPEPDSAGEGPRLSPQRWRRRWS